MRDAIRQKLQTAMNQGWSGVPLVFDNGTRAENGEAWARFYLTYGQENPASIGQAFTRMLGFCGMQIFIPEGKGTKAANDAADAMTSKLRFTRYPLDELGSELQMTTEVDGPTYKSTRDGMAQYHVTMNWRAEIVTGLGT